MKNLYQHGIYVKEKGSSLPITTSLGGGVPVIIGTAAIHLATNPAPINKPVLAYSIQEYTKALGYNDNAEDYTLNEAAYTFFSIYNVAPAVFINVLDINKHYKKGTLELGGVIENPVKLKGDIDLKSVEVTTGEMIAPTVLVADEDYSLTHTEEDEVVTNTLRFLNTEKIKNDTVKVYYKTAADGELLEREITNVTTAAITLDRDTIIDSVEIQTGGVNTLRTLTAEDYSVEYVDNEAVLTLLNEEQVLNDTVTVKYHEVDPTKVTVNDIIGAVDEMGRATGLELVDSVAPMFTTNNNGNMVSILAGSILAPKYSYDERVANAMKAKAHAVSGQFPAMALVDIDTAAATNYQDAASDKLKSALNDPYMVVCWPKVKLGDRQFHLSTHLAALMQRVDAENDDVPFVSPSNHLLSIGGAVLKDGTEVYLTRETANYLNGNGITTALNLAGWRFWGSVTAAQGTSTAPKDTLISVRRMFNYVTNNLAVNFLADVDLPITRRFVDSVTERVNIWLAGLTNRGALLGAELTFDREENSLADLAMGKITFGLKICPPSPAIEINFNVSYEISYLNTLFGE